MADSDGEYVEDLSDDDLPTAAPLGTGTGRHATRSSGPVKGPEAARGEKEKQGRRRAAWEDIQRSWDTVVEGADGSLSSTVEGLLEAGKRQRFVIPYSPPFPLFPFFSPIITTSSRIITSPDIFSKSKSKRQS